jgi:hypothetical protein
MATQGQPDHLQTPLDYAVGIVRHVCHVAGPTAFVENLRASQRRLGIVAAVGRHDTPALFSWLMTELSYQGIADRVAEAYLARHGNVAWADVVANLRQPDLCPKLATYSTFQRCDYVKSAWTCANPTRLAACPLPSHPLRNGRLNQTAYSLHLFLRDVADNDLVGWIDRRLATTASARPGRLSTARAALVDPMRSIYGVSDKLLAMALSALLMSSGRRKPWFDVGASFVVVDTLVHNFLHRTGILQRLTADHPYGAGCYRPGGCADVLYVIADNIDVSVLNPTYPRLFPRFVQSAIWRYCAENGLNVCNGNRIDDRDRCDNGYCRLYPVCDRITLHVPGLKPIPRRAA